MKGFSDKHIDNSNLPALLQILRANKQSIVFTNGCFDLLHPGHIDYLAKAKSNGDVLIVAVNDDASVQNLKGPSRPINPVSDRLNMLAALECVDFVISFSEETPLNIIQKINPDVLVKGGDYNKDEIVGASYVEEEGGQVLIIPFLKGYSSTLLIKRIKNS